MLLWGVCLQCTVECVNNLVLGEIKFIIRFPSDLTQNLTRPPGFYILYFIFLIHDNFKFRQYLHLRAGVYHEGTIKHLFSYYFMVLIDQMDEQFLLEWPTPHAPSITHITDKHLCMYPLKHEICGRETVCKGKYEKLGSRRWNYFLVPFSLVS